MNTTQPQSPSSLHPVVRPCDVVALFCRSDSVYKTIAGVDVWDKERDARKWQGGRPIIAHPPCRAWGRLRHCAKAPPGEKALALWAVSQVRKYGGVLEHPMHSTLWSEAGLPAEGMKDAHGGFTIIVDQFWFGHRARKRTLLYICGCKPSDVPKMPIRLGEAPCTVGLYSGRDKRTCRPSIAKREYDATPEPFAKWLVQVASLCRPND